ncbi:hypothetical protein LZ30DRAFT_200903 [Colletotrichum cereale]|nr:hypothetical protein LZ30DRAFT_200903 [Colletotrichum cereale]
MICFLSRRPIPSWICAGGFQTKNNLRRSGRFVLERHFFGHASGDQIFITFFFFSLPPFPSLTFSLSHTSTKSSRRRGEAISYNVVIRGGQAVLFARHKQRESYRTTLLAFAEKRHRRQRSSPIDTSNYKKKKKTWHMPIVIHIRVSLLSSRSAGTESLTSDLTCPISGVEAIRRRVLGSGRVLKTRREGYLQAKRCRRSEAFGGLWKCL